MDQLSMDPSFAQRNLNEGFSGGEKKRHEILQLELLNPKIAILDETDSGLDIDALQGGLGGHQPVPRRSRPMGVLLITHYTADPAIRAAGLRARLRGRAHRRGGRLGAGRGAGDQRLRAVPCDRCRDSRRVGVTAAEVTAVSDGGRLTRSTSRPSARTSRSSAGRSAAASRWSTWTRARRRRSRARCSTPSAISTPPTTRPRTAAPTCSARRQPTPTRAPGQGRRVHRHAEPRRDRLHQERYRGHQPGRLRDEQRRHLRAAGQPVLRSAPATRSWSPRWSTTPTWCPGSSCASAPARRCAGSA